MASYRPKQGQVFVDSRPSYVHSIEWDSADSLGEGVEVFSQENVFIPRGEGHTHAVSQSSFWSSKSRITVYQVAQLQWEGKLSQTRQPAYAEDVPSAGKYIVFNLLRLKRLHCIVLS